MNARTWKLPSSVQIGRTGPAPIEAKVHENRSNFSLFTQESTNIYGWRDSSKTWHDDEFAPDAQSCWAPQILVEIMGSVGAWHHWKSRGQQHFKNVLINVFLTWDYEKTSTRMQKAFADSDFSVLFAQVK